MQDIKLILFVLVVGWIDGVSAEDLHTGHIIGIVFGCIVFIKIVVIISVTCCAKCKREAAAREAAAAIAASQAESQPVSNGAATTQPRLGHHPHPGPHPGYGMQQYPSSYPGHPGPGYPGPQYPGGYPVQDGYPGYPHQGNVNMGYPLDDPDGIGQHLPPGAPEYTPDGLPPSYEETIRKDQDRTIYPPTMTKYNSSDVATAPTEYIATNETENSDYHGLVGPPTGSHYPPSSGNEQQPASSNQGIYNIPYPPSSGMEHPLALPHQGIHNIPYPPSSGHIAQLGENEAGHYDVIPLETTHPDI